jgi:hypothetical protein
LRSISPSCKIDVSKEYRTIAMVGDTEEAVNGVREAVKLAAEKARNENVFVHISEVYIPQFVGKGGVKLKALSANHGAELQNLRKVPPTSRSPEKLSKWRLQSGLLMNGCPLKRK